MRTLYPGRHHVSPNSLGVCVMTAIPIELLRPMDTAPVGTPIRAYDPFRGTAIVVRDENLRIWRRLAEYAFVDRTDRVASC